MLVKDLMTPVPLTVLPSETVGGALGLMRRRRIRHLPVVDAGGSMVGLITDRDLRTAAPSPFETDPARRAQADAMTVDQLMVRAPWTVGPKDRVKDAVAVMVEKKYGALPVLDGGKLVGILTPLDVLKAWPE